LAIVNDQHYRAGICKQLSAVKQQLGQVCGSVNMAKLALEMLAS
jgi:hypothetical protein